MSEIFQSKQSTVNGIHKIDTTQSPMNGAHKTNDNSSRPASTSHAAINISSGSETSEKPSRTHQTRRILPWSTDRAASEHTQRKREELVQKHRQVAQQDASAPHDRSTVIPGVRNEANLPTRSIGPAIAREAFDKSTDEAKVSSNPVVEKQPQHLNSLLVVPSVTQTATGSLEPTRPASEHQGSTPITLSNNAKPPTDLSMSEAERNIASILKRKRSKTTQRPAEDQPNKKQAVSVKSPLSQLSIAAVSVPTKEPNKCGASQLARQLANGAKPEGRERAQPNHPNAKVTVSSEDAATLRSEANKAAEPVPTNGNPGEGRPVQPHEPQVVERQLPKDGGSRSPQTTFPNDLTGNNLGKAKPAVAFRTVTSPGKAEADNPAVDVGLAQPKPSPEVNQINETKQGVSSRSAAVVVTPNGLGLANPSSLPVARRAQDQWVKTLDTSQNTGTPGVENSSKVADLSETASALQVRSIPLSLSEVEAVLRKHINTSQDDHEYQGGHQASGSKILQARFLASKSQARLLLYQTISSKRR